MIKRVEFEKTRNGGYMASNQKEDWHVRIEPLPGNKWRAKINVGAGYAQIQRRKLAQIMNLVVLMLSNPTKYEWLPNGRITNEY